MATLTREKRTSYEQQTALLASTVPSPFPSAEERARLFAQDQVHQPAPETYVSQETNPFGDDVYPAGESSCSQAVGVGTSHDVMPSIAYVQKSCLMTLNDLLSTPNQWRCIVPDRRHSVPAHLDSSQPVSLDSIQSKAALETLLSNLRTRESGGQMVEARLSDDETELLHELRMRVEALAPCLNVGDASLALTLVSLLSHLKRLSVIGFSPSSTPTHVESYLQIDTHPPGDTFGMLTRQLSDFQLQRLSSTDSEAEDTPPVLAVEKSLLWMRVDENLETVLRLCRQRNERPARSMPDDHLLPEYDRADYEFDGPPGYDFESAPDLSDVKAGKSTASTSISTGGLSEKMRLDLDAVTMAIDRLYLVAPQLHDQRVELKTSKLEELERARLAGPSSEKSEERNVKELERLVEMLGKASDRKLADQTVVLAGGMQAQLEKTRQRNLLKRQEFVEKLAEHSDVRRLHSQDATFQPQKHKDPEALLTLPEFIRESMPPTLQRPADPNALLSLPEFVREAVPETASPLPSPMRRRSPKKGLRSRSMSAPALNWLLPSSSRAGSETKAIRQSRSSRPDSSSGRKSITHDLDVHYVAEHHESLRHILAFLTVSGTTAGANLEAEVTESPEPRLVLRSGSIVSPPLLLPAFSSPGPQAVKVQSLHYEIKLPNVTPLPASDPLPLMDATQLLSASPTTFICASCSLPLVQATRINKYDDLPSEHWGELVESWMCHSDQKLSAQVSRHAKGFWPQMGQALVGGSYILFEESAIMKNNLWKASKSTRGDEWTTVRCICGSFSGRSQEYASDDGTRNTVYRLFKYAIRPVSPSAEPSRIPLSAFIVEDMNELAQAHATYRFFILDEEEERPRLLIWLFKPSMRLSYNAPTAYSIPKQGVIQAAKVLFKILGPSTPRTDLPTLLNQYPGFPQAEQLTYPMEVCQRLAVILTESNKCYPESMRTMTGLSVGWLLRA